MDGLEFDEKPNVFYSRVQASSRVPKLVQKVADKFVGGDARRATVLLLGAVAVMLVLALLWPVVFGNTSEQDIPLSQQALTAEEEAQLLQ